MAGRCGFAMEKKVITSLMADFKTKTLLERRAI